VRGVPGFLENRAAGLPFSRRFATLPDDVKAKYEHAGSFYSFGWSHGKEKFAGTFDVSKGSYYFNPVHDRPVSAGGVGKPRSGAGTPPNASQTAAPGLTRPRSSTP
jgi:hypothetical protein